MLTNEGNVGLPDGIGARALDRLLGNPSVDHVADVLKQVKSKFASDEKLFAKPPNPRPFPPLAPLAGSFHSPIFGKAVLRPEGDTLVLALQETGAQLAFAPWDGDVFTSTCCRAGGSLPRSQRTWVRG